MTQTNGFSCRPTKLLTTMGRSSRSRHVRHAWSALENLESRLLFSVTALVQTFSADLDPIVPYGSGVVTLPQFNGAANTLVGASVDWSLGIAATGSYSFMYCTNSTSIAEVSLSGTLQLSVPGAPDNPQAVSLNIVKRQFVGPFQTIEMDVSDGNVAAGGLELTAAEAQAAGYVGTGAQTFSFDAYAASSIRTYGAGGEASVSGTWETHGRVGADVTYDYYVPGVISGSAFSDRNPDKAVSGWTIILTGTMEGIDVPGRGEVLAAGTYTSSARTDAHGNYRFTDLRPGTYQVSVMAPHGTKSSVSSTRTVILGVDGQATGGNAVASACVFDSGADGPAGDPKPPAMIAVADHLHQRGPCGEQHVLL